IPTNVISITDGQIFLEGELFFAGVRPAINVGISVSRVGGNAQTKMMKQVAGKLKLDLAQVRELEAFTQFGSDLDEATLKQLNRGRKMVELLKQGQYVPMQIARQVMFIWCGSNGYLDKVPEHAILKFETEFLDFCDKKYPDIEHKLNEEKKISDATQAKLEAAVKEFMGQFKAV
ncbi:MAG: F0F1 ATP synthase subunit alpha, partial [bacterium]